MNNIKMQLMVREEPEIKRKINTLGDEHLEGKKVVMVTGHRPQHLWGFNFLREEYKALEKKIEEKMKELEVQVAITGMALGVDMMFAKIALKLAQVETLIAAIPCAKQECKWSYESQTMYYEILKNEKTIPYYVSMEEYNGITGRMLMQNRNKWMVDTTKKYKGDIIAVWKGTPGGTGNCVKYAESVGMKPILIQPQNIEKELQIKKPRKINKEEDMSL